MIPDFFTSPDPVNQIGIWKILIGLFFVLFATLVGVEIRIENDDDDA